MRRILVADASVKNPEAIVQKFKNTISVMFCPDASSFYDLIHEFDPEYLILDLQLPGNNGLTLLRDIRAAGNMIPTVVLSSYVPDFILLNIDGLGMTTTMQKPISLECLIDCFAKLDLLNLEITPHSVMNELNYILSRLGFKAGPTRHSYVEHSCILRYKYENIGLTKELYPAVANHVNGGMMCVEKCIRDAVRYARKRGDPNIWKSFFPTLKPGKVPANEEFLGRIALALRNRERPRKELDDILAEQANADTVSL